MELIPILSTIILVATISTFILAVGAYIVFKVQEKRADKFLKSREVIAEAETLEPVKVGEAELAVDQQAKTQVLEHKQKAVVPGQVKSNESKIDQQSKKITKDQKPNGTKYMKYNSSGYTRIDDDKRMITWR
jgi:Na+-transporting NADH:ubiquinone oxidoreductase subunit NqrC